MSSKNLNCLYVFLLIFCLLICGGVLLGNLSFGLGLGDLAMIISLIVFLIVTGILVFLKSKFKDNLRIWNLIVGISIVIGMLYFIFSITIWRGVEIPWNGHVFIN